MTSSIHQEIDELLTADLHDQLSESERQTLHSHLVECADCRQLHKEYQNMNTALSESFEAARPTPGFENRIVSAFRNRVPDRGPGIVRFLVLALRSRAAQIAAIAVVLLGLLQVGRLITHEPVRDFASADATGSEEMAVEKDTRSPFDSLAKKVMPFSAAAPTSSLADRGGLGAYGGRIESSRNIGGGLTLASDTPSIQKFAKTDGRSATFHEEQMAPRAAPAQEAASDTAEVGQRKLIRNARTELEVVSFNDAVEKITAFARDASGYVATSGSHKQENGKLRGEVVVKVLPAGLDQFLQRLRDLGTLKDQTISTQDVSKQYFDTSARLDNSRVMEQRLVEMLKKNTGKVSDLLQVERELGRVREDIEKMQGELKFMDAQVQFATITITLAEKDMNVPAAFLLKERARVGLFTSDVEKTYNEIRSLASAKVQITNAHLESANGGQVAGHINILVAPEESESTIARVKGFGRVQTFEVQTERVAHGGEGMAENAKTDKDKVQIEVTISREEEEQSRQQTSLRIRSTEVDQNAQKVRELAEREGGQIRHSSFNKDTDGREIADLSVRLSAQNYAAFMQSLGSFGKIEDLTVHREEQKGETAAEKTAPVDLSIQFYSRGNIVADQSGVWATLRRTIGEGAGALMWSIRMIGVALAFVAPWAAALVVVGWVIRRIAKARRDK